MDRLTFLFSRVVALFAIAAITADCGVNGRAPITDAGRAIIAREYASFEAWRQHDRAFYQEYWGDEMTEFLPGRRDRLRKAEQMAQFDQMVGDWKLGPLDILDPEVNVYGDVAVLTYREAVTGSAAGVATHYTGKVTMIYVKRNGRWVGVHYHESKDDASG